MAKVVIWCGQSNSQGAMAMASIQVGYKQTYNNIKVWTGSSFASLNYAVNNNQWPSNQKINCFGSEFCVLTNLQAHWNQTVYGITYSVGGTELGTAIDSVNNWNASTNGSYGDLAIDTVNSALAYMWNTLGIRTFEFYFIWEQGEQDSKNVTDKNNRGTNLTNFISKHLGNLSGTSVIKKIFILPYTNTLITSAQNSASTITAASNASPIVITTSGNHAIQTGYECIIYGVGGNTAANGTWTCTKINATQFSLNNSTGNGTYTSGGFINYFVYPAQIASADSTVVAGLSNAYGYSTDSYSLQSDVTHFDAAGYENKGLYLVNNIIIANNL